MRLAFLEVNSMSVIQASAVCIRLRNSNDKDLDLWIEPLGDHVVIPKHTVVEILCSEQLGHPNEFEMSNQAVSIHGWVLSVSALADDGSARQLWKLPAG